MPKPPSDLPDTQVTPDAAYDKRQYRSFTIEDKKRILAEAEACQERGELGALLRRENIYSSQLQTWRRQLAAQGEAGLHNALPGRKPSTDAKDREIEMLRRQKAQVEQRLRMAEALLELQKKGFALLEQLNNATPS
jgi:transposase